MTQKNFFNNETPIESRIITTDDLPWVDATDDVNWYISREDDGYGVIDDDGVHLYGDSRVGDGSANAQASGQQIYGDFDIQVDWTFHLQAGVSGARWKSGFLLSLYDDAGYAGECRLWMDKSGSINSLRYYLHNPTYTQLPSGTVLALPSLGVYHDILRIIYVQTTNTFTFYVWDNNSWEGGVTYSPNWFVGGVCTNVLPKFCLSPQYAEAEAHYKDFKINSADGLSSSWVSESPNQFYSAKFFDKLEGGNEPVIITPDTFDTEIDNTFWSTWGHYPENYPYWNNGNVRLTSTYDGVDRGNSYLTTKYKFTGDFEIKIDTTRIAGSTSQCAFMLITEGSLGGLKFQYNSGTLFNLWYKTGGSWSTNTGWGSGDLLSFSTATVTLKRTGTTLEISATDGLNSSVKIYTTVLTESESTEEWPFQVSASNWLSSATNPFTWDVDNYEIVSGETTFDGYYDEPPTENWWNFGDNVYLVENKLKTIAPGSDTLSSFSNKFQIKGDFDIQIDFDLTAFYQQNDLNFKILDDEGANLALISLDNQTTQYWWGYSFDGTTNTQYESVSNTITSGSFRITRTGDVFGLYYKSNEDVGWTEITGTFTHNTPLCRMSVYIWSGSSAEDFIVNWSNYVINSCDKIVWYGGTLKKWNGGDWIPTVINKYDYSYNPFELGDLPHSIDFTDKSLLPTTSEYLTQFDDIDGDLHISWLFDNDSSVQLFSTRYVLDYQFPSEFTIKYKDMVSGSTTAGYNPLIFVFNSDDWNPVCFLRLGNFGGSAQSEGIYYSTDNVSAEIDTNNTAGLLRYTYDGVDTLSCYHTPDGGSESLLFTDTNFILTADIKLRMYVWPASTLGVTASITIEDITVQSSSGIDWASGANTDVWKDQIPMNYYENSTTTYTEPFDGVDGDDPDEMYWNKSDNTANSYLNIQSNDLMFNPIDDDVRYSSVIKPSFYLEGDFDIQFSYNHIINEGTNISDGSNNNIGWVLYDQTTDEHIISFKKYTHFETVSKYYLWRSFVNVQATASVTGTGMLRFTRVSGTVTCFYWTGSQWEWNGSTSGYSIGGDFSNTVRLQLEQQQGTDGHSVSTIDEFKVNSCDNIIWNGAGGWGYVGNV